MPANAVIRPPVRKLMCRGAALLKSLAGDTTLAARFVVSVATDSASIESRTVNGPPIRANNSTGSHTT